MEGLAHSAPRTPGEKWQLFDVEMVSMLGEVQNDDDFTLLRIEAGSGQSLPAATGRTTLTRMPNGDFMVDSFFDITYEITYQGAPGGPLEGLSGTNTGTMRIQVGDGTPYRQITPLWPDEIDVIGLMDFTPPAAP
ncbi:MAG: hypothetical protein QNK37_12760 [Acidobacteriota bacterium]|nr:hypothetical protein [Acidobacteriota bacterium]